MDLSKKILTWSGRVSRIEGESRRQQPATHRAKRGQTSHTSASDTHLQLCIPKLRGVACIGPSIAWQKWHEFKRFFRVMLATLQQRWTTFVTSTYFNYVIAMQYSNKNRICTWLQVIWPHFNSENWLLKWPARSITSKNNTSKMHKLVKQMVNASNILVLRSESITFGIT